jgi:hypothetical protein
MTYISYIQRLLNINNIHVFFQKELHLQMVIIDCASTAMIVKYK